MRFAALASVPRITALAAGCSLLIETAQYALQLASRRWWRAGPDIAVRSASPQPGNTASIAEVIAGDSGSVRSSPPQRRKLRGGGHSDRHHRSPR